MSIHIFWDFVRKFYMIAITKKFQFHRFQLHHPLITSIIIILYYYTNYFFYISREFFITYHYIDEYRTKRNG